MNTVTVKGMVGEYSHSENRCLFVESADDDQIRYSSLYVDDTCKERHTNKTCVLYPNY